MKNLKLITYVAIVCFLFTGCNDLLEDPQPADSVSGDAVVTSEAGVQSLRASMYYRLINEFDFSTELFVGPGAIADETRNRDGSTRFQGLNAVSGQDGDTDGLSSYQSTYELILDANLMISGVEDGVLDDQSELDRYRGEAFALRAYVMHHLVRALGYEPGVTPSSGPGAGFDLGIIIRTEPTQDISDVDDRERATVSAVYTQILNDLGQAKTLLAGTTDNTVVSEPFVDGLLARVNLYAGNWSAAEGAASDAISNSGRALVTTAAGVAGMFDENAGNHPEALFKLIVNPNTEAIGGSNVNNGLAAYTSSQWVAQVPTNFVIDLYDAADHRLGWYRPCFNDQQGTAVAGCDAANDEEWESLKWGGEKGNLADDIPHMRIAEMFLIQAEAAAKNSGNFADGLGPLNTLRAARGLGPLVAGVDIASLQELEDEILDERVRELNLEGHRWWDLKRLGRDVPDTDGSTKVRFDSYRILDDIGAGITGVNPLIIENPGY